MRRLCWVEPQSPRWIRLLGRGWLNVHEGSLAGLRLTVLLVAIALLCWPGNAVSQQEPFVLGPPQSTVPVRVSLGFYVSDVNDVDEENQRFEVEGILTLKWKDERLAFDPELVGVDEKVFQGNFQFSEIGTGWWPQTILANESGGYERQAMVLRHRADGSMTYIEEVNATAEIPMELRRFPFDSQRFELIFEVLGFAADEVDLQPDPGTTGSEAHGVSTAQWELQAVSADSRTYAPLYVSGSLGEIASVVISLKMTRRPGFMLRVVVLPLAILVMLSWSVFWMNRESLGDRMDISFVGILTAVAYQIMISSVLPQISYFTWMSAFIYISFLLMCATVVVNLRVGRLDRTNRDDLGELVDRRCRWVFPVTYITLLVVSTLYFSLRY
jgi:hypothetical protein